LDKSHATHVGSKVKHPVAAIDGLLAVGQHTKVEQLEFVTELLCLEVLVLLPVNSDHMVALRVHTQNNVTGRRKKRKKRRAGRKHRGREESGKGGEGG
jgi:hypothetical protein